MAHRLDHHPLHTTRSLTRRWRLVSSGHVQGAARAKTPLSALSLAVDRVRSTLGWGTTDSPVMASTPSRIAVNAEPSVVALDASQTAVIVVDMQNDFGSEGGMLWPGLISRKSAMPSHR